MNLEIKEIADESVWGGFLKSSKFDYFLQTWEWGEFTKAVGKNVTRLGIYQEGVLKGVALLVDEFSRFGNIVYCPRGPVLDWADVSLSQNAVLKIIEHVSEAGNPTILRLDPAVLNTNEEIKGALSGVGFHDSFGFWQVERAWMLDIKGKSENELLSGMRKNSRYYLKKAQKSGVVVELSKNIEEAKIFANMLYEMSKRKGFIALPEEYIIKQIEMLAIKNDMFRLYVAKQNGKVIAGGLFSFYGNEVSYLHGASGEVGDTQAPYLIQWTAITDARDLGIPRFNFWGVVEDKNYHPGYPGFGYSNFKKGFGGYLEQYMRMQDYVFKPIPYKLLTLQEMYRKWRYKGN